MSTTFHQSLLNASPDEARTRTGARTDTVSSDHRHIKYLVKRKHKEEHESPSECIQHR